MPSGPHVITPAIINALPSSGITQESLRQIILNAMRATPGFDPDAVFADGTNPQHQFADTLATIFLQVLTQYTSAVAVGAYQGMIFLDDLTGPVSVGHV